MASCYKNYSTYTAIRCPTLSAPGHGSIDSSSTSYGSTVRYSCEKGYMIYGEAERTCSYNGKWTGAEPTCKREYIHYHYEYLLLINSKFKGTSSLEF